MWTFLGGRSALLCDVDWMQKNSLQNNGFKTFEIYRKKIIKNVTVKKIWKIKSQKLFKNLTAKNVLKSMEVNKKDRQTNV